ncbi:MULTISPECIES: CinA family protein [Microbacterium]|uniref:CinA family protein n=1 Tax=Microbacterium TaxID=33882 RepID=UPI00217E2845|nr:MULTISPECIES: CinA family protein [Microbacterium]UWF78356.1 CinA family protein [Microbacterium neungamense]WCM56533.1 CinA family protein [Microbacterium sp. EF45047]
MNDAAELLSLLRQRGWTLGIAESLTGGALSAEVVAVPGASASLRGAVVAYATPVKHSLLGVDGALLAAHGPVHPEVALQMAAGVRRAVAVDGCPADVGIATTGIAGPDSPDGQPVGTVHIGVVTPAVRDVRSFVFPGDRAAVRASAVAAALRAGCEALADRASE